MPPRKPEGVIPDLIEDLKDFDDLAPRNDGDAVVWDAARKMWVPGAVASGGGGGGGSLGPVKALLLTNPSANPLSNLLATRDGITFTRIRLPWSNLGNWQMSKVPVAHNGSLWVAGNGDNTNGGPTAIATSEDGLDWTPRPSPLAMQPDGSDLGVVNCVAWDETNSLWYATGWDTTGANVFMSSPDGITWTDVGGNIQSDFAGYQGTSMVVVNGAIILATNYPGGFSDSNGDYRAILRSTDGGVTFAVVGLPGDVGNFPEDSMSQAYTLSFANDALFYCTDNSVGPGIWRSDDDGVTWTQAVVSGTPLSYTKVVYGNGRYLAAAAQNWTDNRLLESLDGIAWTDVSDRLVGTALNPPWEAIAWLGDRFLMTRSTNLLMSHDGIDWKLISAPIDVHVYDIVPAAA